MNCTDVTASPIVVLPESFETKFRSGLLRACPVPRSVRVCSPGKPLSPKSWSLARRRVPNGANHRHELASSLNPKCRSAYDPSRALKLSKLSLLQSRKSTTTYRPEYESSENNWIHAFVAGCSPRPASVVEPPSGTSKLAVPAGGKIVTPGRSVGLPGRTMS